MTTSTLATTAVAALVLTITPLATVARAQDHCLSEADDVAALQVFERAVADYVELHRRLEPPLSPLWLSSDHEAWALARARLARAIRDDEGDGFAGTVFGPAVQECIRARLASAVDIGDPAVQRLLRALERESRHADARTVIGEPIPGGRARMLWPGVLRVLPRLPAELEYRFIGGDLVLLDVEADLVVDVLVHALPPP